MLNSSLIVATLSEKIHEEKYVFLCLLTTTSFLFKSWIAAAAAAAAFPRRMPSILLLCENELTCFVLVTWLQTNGNPAFIFASLINGMVMPDISHKTWR